MKSSDEQKPLYESSAQTDGVWPPGRWLPPTVGPGVLWNKVKLLLAVSMYVAVFLSAYAVIISPAYAYEGCTLTWPNAGAMVWLVTLALLPALILPYSLSRPSGLILWWLYLAAYIPSILIPALTLTMPFENLLPLQISLMACMVILWLPCSGTLLAVSRIRVSPTLFWTGFLLVWGACLGFVCVSGRVNMLVSNLASLFEGATEYTIRSVYRNVVLETGRVLAYVVGQLGEALNPFLIAFGLTYRRRMCLVAGIIGQVIVFSLTGFKTTALCAVYLALVALFLKRWRRSFGMALTIGLIAIVLVSAAVDRSTGGTFLNSIFTRRTLVVPGLLTGFYFEHYSKGTPIGAGFHFTHDASILGPSNEIGFAYFGSAEVNANANLWAEGFAEFGIPGIFGYSILVAFLLWLYDSVSARCNLNLAVLVLAMPAIMLSNTGPTTVLISHGGLAAALVLYLSPTSRTCEPFEAQIEPEESHLMSTAAISV